MPDAGGLSIKRIAETAFPAKYVKKGSMRYVAVPISVEERMNLRDGDFLDVVISWPRTEEYEIGDTLVVSDTSDKPKRGRKKKEIE